MTYTLLSLALVILGLISLGRDRSKARGTAAGGASYLVGALSLMLWPESHSIAFDTATHVAGLGRLLNDISATLAVMLQFIFITSLAKAWCRWRRAAIVAYGILLALFVGLWIILQHLFGLNLAHLLYSGYDSGPLPVRTWNTIIGVSILYACVLTFIGYVRANDKIQNRYPRLTTTVGTTIFGMASIYGGLVVAQLIAAWLGFGDIGIRRFLGLIVVVCVMTILAITGTVLFGRRAVRRVHQALEYIRTWVTLSEKQARINRSIERLEQLLNDNITAALIASDQRVHLDKYADGDVIDLVEQHLKAHHVPAYQRKAGRQAVRYLVLNRANAMRPLYDEEGLRADEEDDLGIDDEELLADLSRREQEHIHLFADAARIAGLVILVQRGENLVDGRLYELEPRPEPHGWRRDVAILIVQALRSHTRKETPALHVEQRRIEPTRGARWA